MVRKTCAADSRSIFDTARVAGRFELASRRISVWVEIGRVLRNWPERRCQWAAARARSSGDIFAPGTSLRSERWNSIGIEAEPGDKAQDVCALCNAKPAARESWIIADSGDSWGRMPWRSLLSAARMFGAANLFTYCHVGPHSCLPGRCTKITGLT